MRLRHILAGYRRSAGLSQRALAIEIGINHNALNRFEGGEEVSLENFTLILKWLITDSDEGTRKRGRPKKEAEAGIVNGAQMEEERAAIDDLDLATLPPVSSGPFAGE